MLWGEAVHLPQGLPEQAKYQENRGETPKQLEPSSLLSLETCDLKSCAKTGRNSSATSAPQALCRNASPAM